MSAIPPADSMFVLAAPKSTGQLEKSPRMYWSPHSDLALLDIYVNVVVGWNGPSSVNNGSHARDLSAKNSKWLAHSGWKTVTETFEKKMNRKVSKETCKNRFYQLKSKYLLYKKYILGDSDNGMAGQRKDETGRWIYGGFPELYRAPDFPKELKTDFPYTEIQMDEPGVADGPIETFAVEPLPHFDLLRRIFDKEYAEYKTIKDSSSQQFSVMNTNNAISSTIKAAKPSDITDIIPQTNAITACSNPNTGKALLTQYPHKTSSTITDKPSSNYKRKLPSPQQLPPQTNSDGSQVPSQAYRSDIDRLIQTVATVVDSSAKQAQHMRRVLDLVSQGQISSKEHVAFRMCCRAADIVDEEKKKARKRFRLSSFFRGVICSYTPEEMASDTFKSTFREDLHEGSSSGSDSD
eukprot:CFRG5392T1